MPKKKNEHALLAPSSAHRWLHCTPSAVLEREFPETHSEAADEGTAAHAWCEYKLKKAIHKRKKKPVSVYDSEEMERFTDEYVEYVLEQLEICKQTCKDPRVLVEQKLDMSGFIPEGYGTADCIIVAEDTMHIIDFKYGLGVFVEAKENPQMMCYALGALNHFSSLYDIKYITMHIFQPRRENVQSWTVKVEALLAWGECFLKPRALLAQQGEGEFKCGSWCQFCRAKVKCRARAEEKLKLAEYDFQKPPLLSDDEIEHVLGVIPDLTRWARDVENFATEEAVDHGKKWTGFKVVEGRSVRKFKDDKEAAKRLEDNGYKDIYKQNLCNMTELTRKVGSKQKFDTLLGDLVIKPIGKPTLVPVDDRRPEIELTTNEFGGR